MFSGVSDGFDLALNAPVTETAGHQNAVYIVQEGIHIVPCDGLGIHPFDIYHAVVGNAATLI